MLKDKVFMVLIFLLMILIISDLLIIYYVRNRLSVAFKGVRDLIRGTIVADVSNVWEAYQHFKEMPGVRVVEIKSLEKIEFFQHIMFIFVFQERFVGEIQLRFCS